MLKIFFSYCFFFCIFSLGFANHRTNQIIVCENSIEMMDWDLNFLKEAQQSVEVLACFFGGKTAQDLLKAIALELSKKPELQVHILASPLLLQSEDWNLLERLQKEYWENFHIEFATQVPRITPDIMSVDNHVKLLVVDGTFFSTGGTNLEEKHCCDGTFTPSKMPGAHHEIDVILPSGMRDQDIVGKGPIAEELRNIFFQLYVIWENYNQTNFLELNPQNLTKKNRFFPIHAIPYVEKFETSNKRREISHTQVKVLLGGPHQKKNAITQEYIRLINEAKEEIILEHLYFLPINSILNALLNAVNRGVKLTLITNGLSPSTSNGSSLFAWGNRISYVPLFYGRHFHFWDAVTCKNKSPKNVKIYEYNIHDVWLHKKIMIVDQQTFILGSYNFGIKSAYGDYELIVILNSAKIACDAFKIHKKDLSNSLEISPELARKWYFDPLISCWGLIQKKFSGFL